MILYRCVAFVVGTLCESATVSAIHHVRNVKIRRLKRVKSVCSGGTVSRKLPSTILTISALSIMAISLNSQLQSFIAPRLKRCSKRERPPPTPSFVRRGLFADCYRLPCEDARIAFQAVMFPAKQAGEFSSSSRYEGRATGMCLHLRRRRAGICPLLTKEGVGGGLSRFAGNQRPIQFAMESCGIKRNGISLLDMMWRGMFPHAGLLRFGASHDSVSGMCD